MAFWRSVLARLGRGNAPPEASDWQLGVIATAGGQSLLAIGATKDVLDRGVVGEAILGSIAGRTTSDGGIEPDGFTPNPHFVAFMQDLIAAHGPALVACRNAARAQGSGWLYVIDERTPTPGDAVPPEDILGCFRVADGEIVAGSYQPNPNHRLVTARGITHPPAELRVRLAGEIARRTRDNNPGR